MSRYGLLYLKSSNDPFSGRILTVDIGESGEYVSSDESWKEGRKHGKSSKWFSNGIKMYERNYREGRWHGSVTRWWPNGQKMYVRAYTNGVRHGSEASWRSDGSPLSLPADGAAPAMDNDLEPAAAAESTTAAAAAAVAIGDAAVVVVVVVGNERSRKPASTAGGSCRSPRLQIKEKKANLSKKKSCFFQVTNFFLSASKVFRNR